MKAQQIVDALQSRPVPTPDVVSQLPEGGGFYAWWVNPDGLARVPTTPCPDAESYGLLYVGIAPGNSGSSATIKSRVVGNHLKGNTASSTFRFSLASLLFEQENWTPLRRTKKVVLDPSDNAALSRWQQANAALTWVECADPWQGSLEADVIRLMRPPMNRDHNEDHPFYESMGEARSRFRAAAT
jgi:hypothetical protein